MDAIQQTQEILILFHDYYRFNLWLENKGYVIGLMTPQCPYQIELFHQDGHSIYFRSRGDSCELSFHEDDRELYRDRWKFTEKPNAGYIDDKQAFALFYGMYWDAMARLAE
ncbi:MAG: hypothetical protein AAGA60_15805 [Cyanobacteria bacterium P01_E01_bin.42]